MNKEQAALYERIRAFPLDEPGTEFLFARRLARENGWTQAYTDHVIEEYQAS